MATLTLFDLELAACEKVGVVTFGISSAGSSITLNDRTESTAHSDDQFNGGSLFFVESSQAEIQGQARRILDYDASSGQFTFSTFTSAVAANTKYGIVTPEFNLQLLERLANAALRAVGPLVFSDRSLQTSGNQTVYTMSTVVGRGRPFQVDIMSRTGSSADDPEWFELHGWHIEPSSEGVAQKIVFPRYLPQGRDIRILYERDHYQVTNSTHLIDARIHPELAVAAMVDKMYEYRNSRSRGALDFDVSRWNDAKSQLAEARVRWPIWKPRKRAKTIRISEMGYGDNYAPPFGPLEG